MLWLNIAHMCKASSLLTEKVFTTQDKSFHLSVLTLHSGGKKSLRTKHDQGKRVVMTFLLSTKSNKPDQLEPVSTRYNAWHGDSCSRMDDRMILYSLRPSWVLSSTAGLFAGSSLSWPLPLLPATSAGVSDSFRLPFEALAAAALFCSPAGSALLPVKAAMTSKGTLVVVSEWAVRTLPSCWTWSIVLHEFCTIADLDCMNGTIIRDTRSLCAAFLIVQLLINSTASHC